MSVISNIHLNTKIIGVIGIFLLKRLQLKSDTFNSSVTSIATNAEEVSAMESPRHSPGRYESIEDFYSGKSVLITGGTGFLGKVIIEKLVYSCPDLIRVYVLVREKKNVLPLERFNNMFDSEAFSRLKEEKPETLTKIIPIVADISLEDLGMTDEDKYLILNSVSIVIHLAAVTKFNVPLSEVMKVNVEGTRNLLMFSQKMKKIQAFVYMSTAFCQTDKPILEEIVYPPPMKIEDVYEILKKYDNDKSRDKEIIKDRPNTYAFSKAITEAMVAEIHGTIPTVIIRPSCVVASIREPVPGWVDVWQGPTPFVELVGRGWMRCMHGHKDYAFDMIPLDYVVNATIVAAARCQRSTKVTVYNCCTSTINKLRLEEFINLTLKESARRGYNKLPLTNIIVTQSTYLLNCLNMKLHAIPAHVLDLISSVEGKPKKHVKMQQKITKYFELTKYITGTNWMMVSTRLRDLTEELDPADQLKYPCNPANFKWDEYIPIYFNGVVKYLKTDY